jgi:hypothetical protein
MQKVCEYDKMDGPFCNPNVRDMLKKMEPVENKNNQDQIWKGLEKFKDLQPKKNKKN